MVEETHKKIKKFSGIHGVLYSLFDKYEKIDLQAMKDQTQLLLDTGIQGITVLGLATEVQKLSKDERLQIVRIVSAEVAGKVPFSVTVSGNSVLEQREIAKYAIQNGADCLILQPPTVGSYAANEYIEFYLRVAENLSGRFAIQNAPQYLGRALSIADIAHLRSRNKNFDIIKAECSSVDLADLIEISGSDLTVLNGRGGLEMTDCLNIGASGFILAPEMIDLSKKVYDFWMEDKNDKAVQYYSDMLPALVFVMQSIEHLICYGKRLFGLRANFKIYDRSPHLKPTDAGLKLTQMWAQRLGKFNF